MRIVFHGENAASFSQGFASLVDVGARIDILPDLLASEAERQIYAQAEVIISTNFDAGLPVPARLKLFHAPAAGTDAVDLKSLPVSATVCNCFGHETAIAEYVMAALLARHVPLTEADALLRRGDWAFWAGAPERAHDEMAGKSIGLLGFGHISKAIAARAKAFEMEIVVANRSAVAPSELVDRAFTLDRLQDFWGAADYIVVSLPLTESTKGAVGAAAFNAMRAQAVVINVGRGPVIDEAALYGALKSRRIGGAVIDTWYQYPSPGQPNPQPSALAFSQLPNVLMTPHMSGWTSGTIRRRQNTMAENIHRRMRGEPCMNVVRQGK